MGAPMLELSEYEQLQWGDSRHVLRELPESLSDAARFGYNFVYGGANRHFVVDRTSDGHYVVHPDMNVNGSLLDDTPMELEPRDGYHTFVFTADVTEMWEGNEHTYPVQLQLVVREDSGSGTAPDSLRFMWYTRTLRRGTVNLGDTPIPFVLIGSSGLYAHPESNLWLDLDGDGQGLSNPDSDERFLVRDETVSLDGRLFRFSVDRYGRSLVLEALEGGTPRPLVDVGVLAPDFVSLDIDGRERRLSDYRGKIVLLDFWTWWCGPCRDEAPRLADLYRRYHASGLEILGVSPDETQVIRDFQDTFGYEWPALQDGFESQLHRLYRVVAYPTHVVVARDGTILGGRIDWNTFEDQLADALDSP